MEKKKDSSFYIEFEFDIDKLKGKSRKEIEKIYDVEMKVGKYYFMKGLIENKIISGA